MSRSAGARDDFVSSLSFQMVIVPSALALIGIVVGDWLESPVWAAAITATVAVGACVLWWWMWRRRQSVPKLSFGYASDRTFDGLLFASSILGEKAEQRANFEDLVKKMRDCWQPSHVGCVTSEKSREAGGLEVIRSLFGENGIEVVEYPLADGDHLDPKEIIQVAGRAIRRLGDPASVLIDITPATSIMSVGLYEAALEANVNVGYFEGATPRLILESTASEAAHGEHG